MKFYCCAAVRRMRNAGLMCCVPTMGLMLLAGSVGASAQSKNSDPGEARIYATLYMPGAMNTSDFLDVQTDLRNLVRQARIYGVRSQNAISIYGTADDIALARKIVAEIARPKKSYRLTYTIAEANGDTQHEELTVSSGASPTVAKQGRRVPIVTGALKTADSPSNPELQYQYLDVGINVKAQLTGAPDALELHSTVELSNVAAGKIAAGAQDPVIRQSMLDVTSKLIPGRKMVLGSLEDVPGTEPGSTRHLEITVSAEPVQ